jgi:hypothetical protein
MCAGKKQEAMIREMNTISAPLKENLIRLVSSFRIRSLGLKILSIKSNRLILHPYLTIKKAIVTITPHNRKYNVSRNQSDLDLKINA